MDDINKYLDNIGPQGSMKRLETISFMNLGERSEAARRVIDKRYWRKELMDEGLSFEQSCLIINHHYNQ